MLLTTLPMMSFLLAAAASTFIHEYWKRHGHISVLVIFIYGMYLVVDNDSAKVDVSD